MRTEGRKREFGETAVKADGDASWDSQRSACLNALMGVEHTINGIALEDVDAELVTT